MSASHLATLEDVFQGYVREREGAMPAHVVGTARADAQQRLAVYADAYRLRLVEVLGNDYPALRALAGSEAFSALGEAYLAARPSQHFNARNFGSTFAAFLESQDASLAEMARLEWAMTTVFDHADEPIADLAAATAIAPAAWGAMQVVTQGAQRLLALSFNTGEIRQANDKGLALPPSRRLAAPEHWLVWRQDFEVYYRALAADEAVALAAAQAGRSFADICETLSQAEDAPMRAAGLLRRWLEDGLVAQLKH